MDPIVRALEDELYVRQHGSSAQRIVLEVTSAAVRDAIEKRSHKELGKRYAALLTKVQAEINLNRPESPPVEMTH